MSEIIEWAISDRRIEVYQDNYANWRWVVIEESEAVDRSPGYFDSKEDAQEDAEENAGVANQMIVGGVSTPFDQLPAPPKINVLAEAQQGGYTPPKEMTPEQLAIAEATREKLRGMQKAAEDSVATQTKEREEYLAKEEYVSPDVGMGLDGGIVEPAKPKARARGKKDAATSVEAPSDPLNKQVANRIDPEA